MKFYRFTDEANTWWVELRVSGMQNSITEKVMSIITSNSDPLELNKDMIEAGLPTLLGTEVAQAELLALATTKSLRLLKKYESESDEWLRVSTSKNILTFAFQEETGAATIDADEKTVDIEVAFGTDVTDLVAWFTLSYGAFATVGLSTDQVSGTTENDFTNPVTYIIHSETPMDSEEWTVTVMIAAE